MARKLIVEILGDSKSLERSFTRSTAAANKFGRDLDSTAGRVDKRFTRLQGITQGAFVGGVAATAAVAGIRSVVSAAAESQQVLGQTSVALEATGKSWAQYGTQIEDVVKAQSRLGFDDEALLRTFSLFVRATGDVNQALKQNELAMDVARGRFIDLEQAANLVNKAALGQAGAVRRLGIDTKGATSGTELLTLLTEKYGGAAQAAGKDATTAFDRAKVSIDNAKESIGGQLLPTVAGLTNTLSDTLELFTRLGQVKIPAIHIPLLFDGSIDTGGGNLSSIAHKAVFTLPEFVDLTKDIVNNLLDNWRQATDTATADAATQFGDILNGFTTNIINQGLRDAKGKGQDVDVTNAIQDVLAGRPKGFGTGLKASDLFGPKITGIPKALQERLLDAELAGKGIRETLVKQRDILANAIDDPRNNNRDDRIKIKTALKGVKDNIAAIDADVAAGIKSAADARTARLTKAAADAKAAAEKHKALLKRIREHNAEVAKAAREALAARTQERQFRAIGLSGEGGEVIPGIKNLRQQLGALEKSVVGEDVPKKLLNRLAGVRKVLVGGFGKVSESTRQAINELFSTIRGTFEDQMNQDVFKISPATTALNKNKIVEGLGLDRHTEQLIKSRLSGFNAAGRKLSPAKGTTGAFGMTLPPINVHTTVNLDGQKVARNTTVHQGKHRRSNPPQKRGPFSGGVW